MKWRYNLSDYSELKNGDIKWEQYLNHERLVQNQLQQSFVEPKGKPQLPREAEQLRPETQRRAFGEVNDMQSYKLSHKWDLLKNKIKRTFHKIADFGHEKNEHPSKAHPVHSQKDTEKH